MTARGRNNHPAVLRLAAGSGAQSRFWCPEETEPEVSYPWFVLHVWLIASFLVLLPVLLRARGLLRPPAAPILSWESWLYSLARWPYVTLGVLAAIAGRAWPRSVTFKVTPRGGDETIGRLRSALIAPFVVISLGAAAAAFYGELRTDAVGYVFLCLLEAGAYAVEAVAVPALHAREVSAGSGLSRGSALRRTAVLPLVWGGLAGAAAVAAFALYPGYALRLLL